MSLAVYRHASRTDSLGNMVVCKHLPHDTGATFPVLPLESIPTVRAWSQDEHRHAAGVHSVGKTSITVSDPPWY